MPNARPRSMQERRSGTNGNPSINDAVEQGRSGRGRSRPDEWIRVRARVLQELSRGLTRARIGGGLGVSSQRVTQLTEEACDAVLRGGICVVAAEQACAASWERWCESRGDEQACDRLRGREMLAAVPQFKP